MIECKGLYFGYDKNLLLKDVNLSWGPGELNLLLGRNGVGKSTFLRLLSHLLFANKGKISWHNSNKADFNHLISLIESPTLPTVETAFSFLKQYLSWYPKARMSEIELELQLWGVPLKKKIGNLSQGNIQKIQILRCLLSGCEYIILDEPTAHLDPVQVNYFWSRLRDYQNRGMSFFVSSHHLSEMFVPKSRVFLMHNQSIDVISPDTPWRWRILWKNLNKDHYCDEVFFDGTTEECNTHIANEIKNGRQLLQMVAADWEVPEPKIMVKPDGVL